MSHPLPGNPAVKRRPTGARPRRIPRLGRCPTPKSGGFERAPLEFSIACADQNERDYQRLVDAVKAGRIEAVTGL
jgi:hypothetical protein